MSKGVKHDQGKPDLTLIPKVALDRCAEAFMVGQAKYGRYNYCNGIEASRQAAAATRHLAAWFEGEEFDEADGQHHLGAAMACCAMILREQELGTLIDDRYTVSAPPVRKQPPQQKARPEPVQHFEPEVPTPVNNGAPEEDFGMPPPNKKKLKDTKWYLAARFPNGDERVSTDCYSTQAGAVAVLEEYIKQFPNCTFVAFQGKSYEPAK